MISLARYNYIGQTTTASAAAASAGDGSGGGGSGGGSGGGPAAPSAETNKILVTLNTADRDKRAYPDAASCTLALPDTFQTVSAVTLTSVEVPVTGKH